MQRVSVDFDQARTNVEDGIEAIRQNDSENAKHFAEQARKAMDGVPPEFSYIETYRTALDNMEFQDAFEALANFAAYVREYDGEDYTFDYQGLALERVEDAYRQYE